MELFDATRQPYGHNGTTRINEPILLPAANTVSVPRTFAPSKGKRGWAVPCFKWNPRFRASVTNARLSVLMEPNKATGVPLSLLCPQHSATTALVAEFYTLQTRCGDRHGGRLLYLTDAPSRLH